MSRTRFKSMHTPHKQTGLEALYLLINFLFFPYQLANGLHFVCFLISWLTDSNSWFSYQLLIEPNCLLAPAKDVTDSRFYFSSLI